MFAAVRAKILDVSTTSADTIQSVPPLKIPEPGNIITSFPFVD